MPDVELHDLAAPAVAGVGDVQRAPRSCSPAPIGPAATGVADGPGGVAEPEAERERRLDPACVVPTVPGEHALRVAEHAGFGVEERRACPRAGPGTCTAGGPPGSASPRSTSAIAAAALLTRAAIPRGPPGPIRPTTGRPATRPARRRPCGAGRPPPPRPAPPDGPAARATRGRGPRSPSRRRARRPRRRRRRPARRPPPARRRRPARAARTAARRPAAGADRRGAPRARAAPEVPAVSSTASPTVAPSTVSVASPFVFDLEAVQPADPRRVRGRRPRRPAVGGAVAGVVEEHHAEVARAASVPRTSPSAPRISTSTPARAVGAAEVGALDRRRAAAGARARARRRRRRRAARAGRRPPSPHRWA